MDEIIQALDEAFKEKGLGKVEMPPKPGIHTKPDAFIHAMPAAVTLRIIRKICLISTVCSF